MSDPCLATHFCVALGQSPQLSVPQFLHWKIGIINNVYLMGLIWKLDKEMYVESLAHT